MTDTAKSPRPAEAPSISVLTQYIKDMSFENPNAPMSLAPQQQAPAIAVNVNVNARALSEKRPINLGLIRELLAPPMP